MANNALSPTAVVPTQKSEETHAAYFALISLAIHGLIAQIPANLVAPTPEKMSSVAKEVRVRLDFEDVTLQSLPPSLRYRSRIEALESEKLAELEKERKTSETKKTPPATSPKAPENPLAAVLPESPEAQAPTSPVAVPVEQAIAEASAFNRAQANAPKSKKPTLKDKPKKDPAPEGKKEKKRISDEELLSGLFDVPADDSLRLRPDETVFAPSYPAQPAPPPRRSGPVPSYMSNAMPSQVYPPLPRQPGTDGRQAVIGAGGPGQNYASVSGGESERNIQALDKYERALTAWIGQFQDVPAEAVRQNLHGAGVVMIEISRAGVVRNVSVIRSTGVQILDNAAKNMARASSPVVPVPPYYRPEEAFLRFAVPFRF
ncbi:MAG: TonB family protein [Rickettsiales bacterium]